MQTLSRTLKEAIRGTYQVPLAKLEIYNQDGSLAATVTDVESCSINVAGSRKVLRTFSATLNNEDGQYTPDPDQYERNILWYNKTVKIFYGFQTTAGEEYLPQGEFTLDVIHPKASPDGSSLDISGQDQISKLIEDKFTDTYKVTDSAATESANHALATAGSVATASSNVAAGDEIQQQGRIHYVDTFAVINGNKLKAENENTEESSDTVRIIDGSTANGWRQNYTPKSGESVTEVESEIFIDLQSQEDLQEITLLLETDTVLTDFVYYSADNVSWTSTTLTTFDPAGLVRFIRFKVRRTTALLDGSWTLAVFEVQCKTAKNFTPALAIDGDVYGSHWRPKVVSLDPDPNLTIDFGAVKAINAIYLYWSDQSFDFWNRVKYFLESSSDAVTWTRITDINGLDETKDLFGDVEHVFTEVSCRYIRINIKDRDGICKLRHVKTVKVTAIQTVDKVIKDVLATVSGLDATKVKIPITRRWIKKKMAEIGEEKELFCRTAAGSIGWEDPYMDENGYYVTGPRDINPVDLAWAFDVETDNIFSFSPRFSNDIFNVIVVVQKTSGSKGLVGKAEDDNPLSPTFTGKIGRRVRKYEGESYDTQDKVDQYARQKLFERTRFKHQTSIPVTGHPGIQPDDVVTVNVPEAKVESLHYLVTGYVTTFDAAAAQFDTRINISQL
jgi:hypothetical protein